MASDAIRDHVHALLRAYLDADELRFTDDGSVPIRSGSAAVFVELTNDEVPMVHVYSPVLSDVAADPELFVALNDINATIDVGRVYWNADTVMASVSIVAETLDLIELSTAADGIADLADRYDDELQARFGGERTFDC